MVDNKLKKDRESHTQSECRAEPQRSSSRVIRFAYSIWEPLPKFIRSGICWCLKTAVGVLLVMFAVVILSRIRPDLAVNISFGDFKIASNAASQSASEAQRAERRANEALSRIDEVAHLVQGQRATLDAAFTVASDANRLSGMATQTLTEAKQSLEGMKRDAEFIDTVARAMSGYSDAYDSLTAIGAADPRFANRNFMVEAGAGA